VKYVVDYGLAHRKLDKVETIGVDEFHTSGGQNYLTLVYQLDEWCKRLLWCGPQRRVKTLLKFFRGKWAKSSAGASGLSAQTCGRLHLRVIKKSAPGQKYSGPLPYHET